MQSHGNILGLDISTEHLSIAASNLPGIPLIQGDAHALPYSSALFDISICHFLLLWVTDPILVVSEMARVTKPGGSVLALAEPDYGGRIDYPVELGVLGDWQQVALRKQGADPLFGRRLRAVFQQAGLTFVEAGVLGGQWSGIPNPDDVEIEWKVMEDDILNAQKADHSEVARLKRLDHTAWELGERVLFVPTFYAWGKCPSQEREQ